MLVTCKFPLYRKYSPTNDLHKMKTAVFLFYLISTYILYLIISAFYLSCINETKIPILLWWTDFISEHETISCSYGHKCMVSGNIEHINHHHLEALLFYGTNLQLSNLPQRNFNIPWVLFHEESPKNLPALRSLKLQHFFNITSTFSRYSTFPITLQYLKHLDLLTDTKYFVDVRSKNRMIKEINQAAILYLQSDCGTPIGRDKYVKELMKYIKVDSYGGCLNNKQLPPELALNGTYQLYASQLLEFCARYKFIIAIENAKCDDYITEKLWRSLIVGAIPIYLGSPTIKDWLPNEKSAILIDEFPTIQSLAEFIETINNDNELYNSFMNHKLKQLVTNQRLINAYKLGNYGQNAYVDDVVPAFQCFVCDTIHTHKNVKLVKNSVNIYDCSQPEDISWHYSWKLAEEEAKNL